MKKNASTPKIKQGCGSANDAVGQPSAPPLFNRRYPTSLNGARASEATMHAPCIECLKCLKKRSYHSFCPFRPLRSYASGTQKMYGFGFIASFAFVLQRCKQRRLRAKPIPLKIRASLGSPLGRAPAVAGERVVVATICPLRRIRRHLSQRERLFVSSIINKSKEKTISLPKFVCRGDSRIARYRFVCSCGLFVNRPYE